MVFFRKWVPLGKWSEVGIGSCAGAMVVVGRGSCLFVLVSLSFPFQKTNVKDCWFSDGVSKLNPLEVFNFLQGI